jgi:hypothetical protein
LNVVAVFCNGTMIVALTYFLSARYQVFGAIAALAAPSGLVTFFLRIYGKRFLASAALQRPDKANA